MRTLPKMNKRGDISSPIIVILVTVAALAVAGMAIAWMASTGAKASSTGSLVVVGTPTVTATDGKLYITIKNLGNTDVNVTAINVGSSSYTTSFIVPAGASVAGSYALTPGTCTSGNTYNGIITSTAGIVQFTANCQ